MTAKRRLSCGATSTSLSLSSALDFSSPDSVKVGLEYIPTGTHEARYQRSSLKHKAPPRLSGLRGWQRTGFSCPQMSGNSMNRPENHPRSR
ncbi:uncharacterized protein YALI1_A01732g [Yarrowia lipolytica]|uniref:Uncharacterized protein n=1 Tax=Yarrowia lipolytica TaxID=4952 RepID=A0A1D8N3B8_YARLL|nr:hypothetical protein YALI1_A01732g [Yarrowia lipolytica]